MTIKIITDDTLSPQNTSIEVNGNQYKSIEGMKLIIAKDGKGNLVITHKTGYLEAYKGNSKTYE